MEYKKLTTDNSDLLFIGYDGFEEYYQETGKHGGWSFMGLRPNTEDELRDFARNSDIEDYLGKIPQGMERYIDYEAFADDMEEDWEERHDVQVTIENEEGETLYLGFGSGQDVNGYFSEHNINSYEDYCNHFEIVGLTKREFNKFKKEYL